ncbi:MAG: hypothetical protein M1826_006895 [Phylliscum demangeonii]|nr:MAG: hypothetical protein M1826_006895 [Phylliscum demangeonii]
MAFLRQTWALTKKNLLIALVRHRISTLIRAFFLPVAFMLFLAFARNLFLPNNYYGIATSRPIQSLATAMKADASSRNTLVLVNGGFAGGDIDRVIEIVASPVRQAGKSVKVIQTADDLFDLCPSTIRGVTTCFGAAVFYSSPTEGPGGIWNYTLRADGAVGFNIDVRKSGNDVQVFALPLQHAVDAAIASVNATEHSPSPLANVMEYPYTSITQDEYTDRVRVRYMKAIINFLGVAYFVGVVGVMYHLVGFAASEREMGMSPLLEAMMPNTRRWQPRAARFFSYHLAFDLIYLPGWAIIGAILGGRIFKQSNIAISILYHILIGVTLSSFSIFGTSFFKKAQLSGITTTIVALLLAIIAQVVSKGNGGAIAILGLLFPPMNYVFFVISMARFERLNMPTNLLKSAPDSPWKLPGIVLCVFLVIQIIVYPILGAIVERSLYGTASKGRRLAAADSSAEPVRLTDFTKHYPASRLSRRKATVHAVSGLTLTARRGQIMALLGANGSGKTTTLEAIAGLNTITSGTIEVDGAGGLGICPQKNVMWDDLTVAEHIRIFNQLKNPGQRTEPAALQQLIAACDLDRKIKAKSKTLSGGQKRKLQLAMMFTGGSHVCCVDEVSSGLDPLSRRKIWDILLRERGARTIILTTHFLDEADILADHIAILSKGTLKAQGSAVELKHQLGGGYRVHVYRDGDRNPPSEMLGVLGRSHLDQITYMLPTSAETAQLVNLLEAQGFHDYRVSGPSIEDVFLKVAEEVIETPDGVQINTMDSGTSKLVTTAVSETGEKIEGEPGEQGVRLLNGKRIGMPKQAWVLFRKRLTILRRNFLPYLAALIIPVLAAGLVTLFLKNYKVSGCGSNEIVSTSTVRSFDSIQDLDLVVGPASKLTGSALSSFQSILPTSGSARNISSLLQSVHIVDTLDAFNNEIHRRYANVTPGGFFLGNPGEAPTFAYKGDVAVYTAVLAQNSIDRLLTNISIETQYAAFDFPVFNDTGSTLQLIIYFCLAMSAYPAFFALYPTFERNRNIRALHYSNGVRSLPLWLAYLAFDFCFVLPASVLAVVILAAANNTWYHVGYLFVVFVLYGLASTTLAYVISLFAKSQLAAFAFCAGGQCVMFLLYFISYTTTLTYSPPPKLDSYLKIVHFTVALITPSGNLARAMLIAVNSFSIDCQDKKFISNAGGLVVYGGPILYLILQTLLLFGVLLWWDSRLTTGMFRRTRHPNSDEEEKEGAQEMEIVDELRKVHSTSNGLRALHLTKAFGSNLAVEDITFAVSKGEVFALLGPNGAGKSTTISMIRGEIAASRKDSEIFVENISLQRHRAAARGHMGVCPQFDAMDQMTAMEHLRFYARIRGVPNVEHNVREIERAVGLLAFSGRMATKLSGGNKRKLSLAIALMGNPAVLLLDEPSSGMDAAAKRVMWKTLASVVPNRSIVLTTHSMEEADALADRAGIMATKMLALGTTDYLRKKHGDAYHVHLVTTTAPHTSPQDMDRIRAWVAAHFAGAAIEAKTYHGQLRFSVPARMSAASTTSAVPLTSDEVEPDGITRAGGAAHAAHVRPSGIGALFNLLERHKTELGLEYYSVSQTTLDQVFLTIIGKHNIEEEGHADRPTAGPTRFWRRSGR